MNKFQDLIVYQKAYDFALKTIKITANLNNERIKDQLFGSVTSVPANITEMCGFKTDPFIKNKIRICIGECNETEFWLTLCNDLNLLDAKTTGDLKESNVEIRKMLNGLFKKFNSKLRDKITHKISTKA